MLPFACGVVLLTLLCAHALAQGTSRLALPESQGDSLPSKTSYDTFTNSPTCTGCLLEAIRPTQLSYPGTVYCLDLYTITSVPMSIRYTHTASDGCVIYSFSPYTPAPPGPISTTSITWDVDSACLTWPTTYLAYSSFQAGTWSRCGCGTSDCTMHPTTVTAQTPIIYPMTELPGDFAPVPPQVVESILHDPSISIPFNISTCTAHSLQPRQYAPSTSTPPSCVQLPPTTRTNPNTFFYSTTCQTATSTPPTRLHAALNVGDGANADPNPIFTSTHTRAYSFEYAHGGDFEPETKSSGSTNTSMTTLASITTSNTPTSSASKSSPSIRTSTKTSTSISSEPVFFQH